MMRKRVAAKSDTARRAGTAVMSLVLIAAGGALAKNHDAQRMRREASEHVRHDRAAGPLEASNTLDRTPD